MEYGARKFVKLVTTRLRYEDRGDPVESYRATHSQQ